MDIPLQRSEFEYPALRIGEPDHYIRRQLWLAVMGMALLVFTFYGELQQLRSVV